MPWEGIAPSSNPPEEGRGVTPAFASSDELIAPKGRCNANALTSCVSVSVSTSMCVSVILKVCLRRKGVDFDERQKMVGPGAVGVAKGFRTQ